MKNIIKLLSPWSVCSEVSLVQNFAFMDDNARLHSSQVIEELLEREDISEMDCAACFPDLNPIEHVWNALRRCLAARSYPPESTRQLKQMFIEE